MCATMLDARKVMRGDNLAIKPGTDLHLQGVGIPSVRGGDNEPCSVVVACCNVGHIMRGRSS